MKVKNIAFSGFAAAILAGVCGAADAAAYKLASQEYVVAEMGKKQDLLDEDNAGAGIKIEGGVISSTVDVAGEIADALAEGGKIANEIAAVESVANQASSDAASAVTQAGQAVTTAGAAQEAATAAGTAAQEAKDAATTATSTANAAKEAADSAVAVANTADAAAGRAETVAGNAVAVANEAKALAETKQDKLTAGENISITTDETTGELKINSTYIYDDSALTSAIQQNTADIAGKAAQADLEALEGTVDAVSAKADANEAAIAVLNGDKDVVGSVANSVEGLKNELASAGTNVSALSARVDTIAGDLDTAESEIDTLQGQLGNANIADYSTTEQMNAAIEAAAYDDTALAGRVSANESAIEAAQGNIETLQQNSLSKESMGEGSFLVTNDGENISYTAIEIVGADGVTNVLTGLPLSSN